jgi:hypothetical protein
VGFVIPDWITGDTRFTRIETPRTLIYKKNDNNLFKTSEPCSFDIWFTISNVNSEDSMVCFLRHPKDKTQNYGLMFRISLSNLKQLSSTKSIEVDGREPYTDKFLAKYTLLADKVNGNTSTYVQEQMQPKLQEQQRKQQQQKLEQRLEQRQQRQQRQQQQQKQQELEGIANDELNKMGDNLEVTLQYQIFDPLSSSENRHEEKETPVKFSDFKTELETLASETIQKIEKLFIDGAITESEKASRVKIVTNTLEQELDQQLAIMKEIYIAQKVGYNIKEEDTGGKMTLFKRTSDRVNDNLKNRKKITEQANPPRVPTNTGDYVSEHFEASTPIPDFPPIDLSQITPEQRYAMEHHGFNPDRQQDTGPSLEDIGGQRF